MESQSSPAQSATGFATTRYALPKDPEQKVEGSQHKETIAVRDPEVLIFPLWSLWRACTLNCHTASCKCVMMMICQLQIFKFLKNLEKMITQLSEIVKHNIHNRKTASSSLALPIQPKSMDAPMLRQGK